MKPKTCKGCGDKFAPVRPMQCACSPSCALAIAIDRREKAEAQAAKMARAADKVKREKLKRRADWLSEAQEAVNRWVRLRDKALPCVSCGRHHQGQYHAGHYLSRGARPELRFEPLNIHKQCAPCNEHLSGNLVLYRVELIKRIGLDKVEWLEGPHEPKKYTVDEIRELRDNYRKKARELERAMDCGIRSF